MNIDINGPIKVLVVDDEEMIRELYSQILSDQYCGSPHPAGTVSSEEQLSKEVNSSGTTEPVPPVYDLTLCSQGEDAVEAVRNDDEEFAMAFIDVRMPPGRDGIWTAESIRAVSPGTRLSSLPVTVISIPRKSKSACHLPTGCFTSKSLFIPSKSDSLRQPWQPAGRWKNKCRS